MSRVHNFFQLWTNVRLFRVLKRERVNWPEKKSFRRANWNQKSTRTYAADCTSSFMLVKPIILSHSNAPPTGHLNLAASTRPSPLWPCSRRGGHKGESFSKDAARCLCQYHGQVFSPDAKRSSKPTCLLYPSSN